MGAITGSLLAPWLTRRLGAQNSLFLSIATWGLGCMTVGLAPGGGGMAAAMLWNVITLFWWQRRVPQVLLGRVNGLDRFFG